MFVDRATQWLKLLPVTKPAVTRIFGRRATLKRSFGLLSDFRHEQSAPDIFYGALARDSVELISDLHEGHTGRSSTVSLSSTSAVVRAISRRSFKPQVPATFPSNPIRRRCTPRV